MFLKNEKRKKKMIIGFCGKIGSGKDTGADYLVKTFHFEKYSFAEPLKRIGKIFGFSDAQLYGTQENKLEIHAEWGVSSRTFLQKVGTELFLDHLPRTIPEMKIKNGVWADIFEIDFKSNPRNIIISDVRYQHEVNAIRSRGGFIIRVIRENNVISSTKEEIKHKSEVELENIKEDFVLDNNVNSKEEAEKILFDFVADRIFEKIEKLNGKLVDLGLLKPRINFQAVKSEEYKKLCKELEYDVDCKVDVDYLRLEVELKRISKSVGF